MIGDLMSDNFAKMVSTATFGATRFGKAAALNVAPVLVIVSMAMIGWLSSARADNGVSVAADYSFSLAGLPFARAKLAVDVKGGRYTAKATAASWGLVNLFVRSDNSVSVNGRLRSNRVRPVKYSFDSKTNKESLLVSMRMSRGAIRTMSAQPPNRKLPDRVPVRSKHKRNVLDPLSAMIVPYKLKNGVIGKDACNKTVPIFDGWSRFDVKLHFRRFADVRTKGYMGKAAVCGARWVPVAGHRPNKKTVIYLRENKGLETWLIPVPGGDILLPYRMSIKTKSGTLVVRNKRFVVTGNGG